MSTLKFKSKIEVPGIDVKGGDISGVNNIYANKISSSNQVGLELTSTYNHPVSVDYLASQYVELHSNDGTTILTPESVSSKKIVLSGLSIVNTTSDLELVQTNGSSSPILTQNNFGDMIDANDISCIVPVTTYAVLYEDTSSQIYLGDDYAYYYEFEIVFDQKDQPVSFEIVKITEDNSIYINNFVCTNNGTWQKDGRITISNKDYPLYNDVDTLKATLTLKVVYQTSPISNIQETLTEISSDLTTLSSRQKIFYIFKPFSASSTNNVSGYVLGELPFIPEQSLNQIKITDISAYTHIGLFYSTHTGGLVPCKIIGTSSTNKFSISWYDLNAEPNSLEWNLNDKDTLIIIPNNVHY